MEKEIEKNLIESEIKLCAFLKYFYINISQNVISYVARLKISQLPNTHTERERVRERRSGKDRQKARKRCAKRKRRRSNRRTKAFIMLGSENSMYFNFISSLLLLCAVLIKCERVRERVKTPTIQITNLCSFKLKQTAAHHLRHYFDGG